MNIYANNSVLKGAGEKAVMMLTYGDETEESIRFWMI